MKKLILLLAIGFIGTQAIAQNTADPTAPVKKESDAKKPQFKFNGGDSHDFGTLEEGGVAEYKFVFKNTGKSPLIIQNAAASCGCTTPEWSKEPVKPGKTGTITVRYDTKGRPGPFTKNVWITSNAGGKDGADRYELTIKGTVNAAKVNPDGTPKS